MSARYPAAEMRAERKNASGLSLTTLMIASASSVAAAIVVSRLWGAGTLVGAAATPVIVALVTEGLHRPARVVTNVRGSRTARFDPVAEGRRGMQEGDLERARPARPGEPAAAPVRQGRPARATTSRSAAILRRRRMLLAVATGLVAFVIGGVFLTGTELVFGDSAVSGASKRTTFLGGSASRSKTDTTSTEESTTPTTSTSATETTTTGTETQPGVVPNTETAPPAAGGTTTTQPGVAPPATTSPGGTPAPSTTAPAAPPATTTP